MMTRYLYLVYVPDLSLGSKGTVLTLYDEGGQVVTESAAELSEIDAPVITYEVSTLVDDLRTSKVRLPPLLIDVGEALRLITGLARDDGGERRWDALKRISQHFRENRLQRQFTSIVQSRAPRPPGPELRDLLTHAGAALRELWLDTLDQLNRNGERER